MNIPFLFAVRLTLFEKLKMIDKNLRKLSDNCFSKKNLKGDSKYNHIQNRSILHYSIMFMID